MAVVSVTAVKLAPDGDSVTITGTVDGVLVTAHGWRSATTGMTGAQKLHYAAVLLKQQADALVDPTDLPFLGTVPRWFFGVGPYAMRRKLRAKRIGGT